MADPPESLLKWAAFALGEEATVVSVTGLHDGASPWRTWSSTPASSTLSPSVARTGWSPWSRAVRRLTGRRRLKSVRVPVLLVLGKVRLRRADGRVDIREHTTPAATVEVFHCSGHTPYPEEPAESLEAAGRWVRQFD